MRLTRKNYVSRVKGDPSSERGGKSKYFYRLTRDGKQALLEIKASHEKVWTGVPRITSDQILENE